MTQRLFVYGTLGPGRPNEHVLTAIGGTWENGSVNGYLRSEGWGAEMGYPGIVLDARGDEIAGFIFSSENLEHHWGALDDFEGAEYERVLTDVKVAGKTAVSAYIYVLKEI